MYWKIKNVTAKQANAIITTRKPLGRFLYVDKNKNFIGIDNRNGEAWTEEFKSLKKCVVWLLVDDKPELQNQDILLGENAK